MNIVVVCSIFYVSAFPFSANHYRTTIQTTSETKCHKAAQEFYLGQANADSYDLNTEYGRLRYTQICGANGQDCRKYN
jgi:hypothetical protein